MQNAEVVIGRPWVYADPIGEPLELPDGRVLRSRWLGDESVSIGAGSTSLQFKINLLTELGGGSLAEGCVRVGRAIIVLSCPLEEYGSRVFDVVLDAAAAVVL